MSNLFESIPAFFSTSKDYGQVLKKLAVFAFCEVYIITLFLRANPTIDGFFSGIEFWGPIGKATSWIPHYADLNVGGAAIALFVAILSNIFQFHDRISDVFGIRRRFDCTNILIPLSISVGSEVSTTKPGEIEKHRDRLMRSVFYKYASSRDDTPLVDKHDIEHAMNAWSWFWVFVEAIAYFGTGAVIALWLGSKDIALIFAAVAAGCFVIAICQRPRLRRYTKPQIDQIAGDAIASTNIKQTFDAL
jgi:hypothetical protein